VNVETRDKAPQAISVRRAGPKRGCMKPLCLVLALVFVLWAAGEWLMARRADGILADLAAEGFPTTLEALCASHQNVPQDRNAAEKYSEAIIEDQFLALGWDVDYMLPVVGIGEPPDPHEPWSAERLAVVGRYLEANARTMALIHEAAERPTGRHPLEFGPELYDSLSHFASLRHLARTAELEALYHAERGDPDAAVAAVLAILALGRSLEEAPLVVPQAVRLSTAGMAAYALKHIVNRTRLPGETLEALAQAFAWPELEVDLGQSAAWRRGCAGEMCLFASYFVDSTTYMAATDAILRSPELARQAPRFVSRVAYRVLPNTDRALGLAGLRAVMDGAEPNRDVFTMLLENAHIELIGAFVRTAAILPIATLRMANLAIALERYRAQYGTLPETLDALTPDFLRQVPLDPLVSQDAPRQIQYAPVGQGYVLYSVGMNGVDDGGIAAESSEEGDEVFAVSAGLSAD